MSEHFTFRQEVLDKCENNEDIYDLFMESLDALPLAADINQDYLCMHGGISKELKRRVILTRLIGSLSHHLKTSRVTSFGLTHAWTKNRESISGWLIRKENAPSNMDTKP